MCCQERKLNRAKDRQKYKKKLIELEMEEANRKYWKQLGKIDESIELVKGRLKK